MTLIEQTYLILKQAGLTTTRQAFSREYVGKNQNWFSYQAHMNRDFSITAAIRCLRAVRFLREHEPTLQQDQKKALRSAEVMLLEHLNERHRIAEVCL